MIGTHDDAAVGDQERVLVGAVQRAAVLHHAQAPGGDLVVDPVVEGDHAVGDVLLDAEPGQAALVAALTGDDHGEAALLEPAEQPAELAADDRLVGQRAEEQLDRVQHDALGADRVHRRRRAG